jgi:hypothetical protein
MREKTKFFRPKRLVNRALEWLLLIPHFSNPVEHEACVFPAGKGVKPKRQTEVFLRRLRALLAWHPWYRIMVDLTAVHSSKPANVFKSKVDTNELVAGRT